MCKTYDINYRDQTVSSLTAWLDQQSKSLVLLMAASYLRLARTSQRSGNNGDNGDEDVNNDDRSHDGHHGNNENMKIYEDNNERPWELFT